MPTIASNVTMLTPKAKNFPQRSYSSVHAALPPSTLSKPRHGTTQLSLTYGSFVPFPHFLSAAGHAAGGAAAEAMLRQMGLMEKEIYGIAHRTELIQNGPYHAAKTFLEAAKVLEDGSEAQQKRFEWAEKEFVRAAGQIPSGIYQSECYSAAEECANYLKQPELVQKYHDDAQQALKKGYLENIQSNSLLYNSVGIPVGVANWLGGSVVFGLGGPLVALKAAFTNPDGVDEEMQKFFNASMCQPTKATLQLLFEKTAKERRDIVKYAAGLTSQSPEAWLQETKRESQMAGELEGFLSDVLEQDRAFFQKQLPSS